MTSLQFTMYTIPEAIKDYRNTLDVLSEGASHQNIWLAKLIGRIHFDNCKLEEEQKQVIPPAGDFSSTSSRN